MDLHRQTVEEGHRDRTERERDKKDTQTEKEGDRYKEIKDIHLEGVDRRIHVHMHACTHTHTQK